MSGGATIAQRRATITDDIVVTMRARRNGHGQIVIEVEGPATLTRAEQVALTRAVGEWRRELGGEPALGQCWADGCRARVATLYCTEHQGLAAFGVRLKEARRRARAAPGGD